MGGKGKRFRGNEWHIKKMVYSQKGHATLASMDTYGEATTNSSPPLM